jgi:hypothetical protein
VAPVQLRQHPAEARARLRSPLFILDSLLIGGLRFVLDKVAAAADMESADPQALREQLLDAGMKLELGEISSEEYRDIERDVLARLRTLTSGAAGPVTVKPGDRIAGVDVEVYDDRE